MVTAGELRLARLVEAYRAKAYDTRHKCFLSYHAADVDAVANFVTTFGEVFIPKVIGLSESDPLIGSNNTEYVMDRIREKYLTDSSVTIVLLGKCTWSRRFVDWEVLSSLRRDRVNRLNGLMAVELPTITQADQSKLPPRVRDNLPTKDGTDGYARWYNYPTSSTALRKWVQDAFDARSTRAGLINNSRARKISSSPCN